MYNAHKHPGNLWSVRTDKLKIALIREDFIKPAMRRAIDAATGDKKLSSRERWCRWVNTESVGEKNKAKRFWLCQWKHEGLVTLGTELQTEHAFHARDLGNIWLRLEGRAERDASGNCFEREKEALCVSVCASEQQRGRGADSRQGGCICTAEKCECLCACAC